MLSSFNFFKVYDFIKDPLLVQKTFSNVDKLKQIQLPYCDSGEIFVLFPPNDFFFFTGYRTDLELKAFSTTTWLLRFQPKAVCDLMPPKQTVN